MGELVGDKMTPSASRATHDERTATSWVVWLAFGFVVILGGSNAVAVRFSNAELPPFWGASFRFLAAGAIFWVVVLVRRIELPKGRALVGALIFGALSIGLAYALMYWGLVYAPASLTMIILAMGPLMTFLFAWAHGQEAFRWRGLIGAVVAFGGILIGVGSFAGSSIPPVRILAIVLATAALSESSVVFKFYPESEPLAVNALALSIGTPILLIISLLAGETWRLPTERATWLATGYLALGGSALLFYLFLFILKRWTASSTSYSALLFPVATIIIASWLADEIVSPRFLVGGAIVLVGVWAGAVARGEPGDRRWPPNCIANRGSKDQQEGI